MATYDSPPRPRRSPTSVVASASAAAASSSSSSSSAAPAHPNLEFALLDIKVCGDDGRKPNAASALSMNLHQVHIWMEIDDSTEIPAVSHVRYHCSDRFALEPCVVGAEGRLVLVHAQFEREDGEYFMYNAGDPPSLCLLPVPPKSVTLVKAFAVIPREESEHFLLMGIGFVPHSPEQVMIVYSSEDNAWSAKPISYAAPGHPNGVPSFSKVIPSKAVPIGGNRVIWIDFGTAILVSDHSVDPPVVQYIPFPPGRKLLEPLVNPIFSSKLCRDVGFSKGLIKYVEVENHVTVACPYQELVGGIDMFSDEELCASHKKFFKEPEFLFSVDGWRIVTWSRPIAGNSWCNRQAVDRFGDRSGSVIAVDMSKKQLKDLGTQYFPSDQAYRLLKVPKNSLQVRLTTPQVHGAGSSNNQQEEPEEPLPPPQQASGNFCRWNLL
ncbi:unnamed protein product [Urochloa humidicola]